MASTERRSDVDVSVVIATYDPPASFARTLQALLCRQGSGEPSREVLVVDNHPRRTRETSVAPFETEGARFLWEPRRGKCRAVNRGIRAASGAVLHFLDQDNVPAEGYLASLWRAFRDDPTVTVLTGRVEPSAEGGYPLTLKRSLQREEHRHPLVPAAAGHGNNLSVRRKVLAEVGLFDTRFGPGTYAASGEDTDLIYRLARAGHSIVYEPGVCNTHEHGRSDAAAVRRARLAYARGRGAFYMKHLRRGDPWVARLCYWELLGAFGAALGSWLLAPGTQRSWVARVGETASRPALHPYQEPRAKSQEPERSDYPEPWLNLRGLLAGMAWMAPRWR
jgi:GT2 family glycosyltransferase